MPWEVVDMPSRTSHEETRGNGIGILSTLSAGSSSAPKKLTSARLSREMIAREKTKLEKQCQTKTSKLNWNDFAAKTPP